MNDWKDGKNWSDRFLPEIRQILSVNLFAHMLLVEPPDAREDQMHNTDLIVLRFGDARISCRVRNDEYRERYGNEFTIRSKTKNGGDSELSKVVKGWGDYTFYGFGDDDTGRLTQWFIGDLGVFRLWFNRALYKCDKCKMPGTAQSNGVGDSDFVAFKKTDMPEDFFIAEYTGKEGM